MRTVSSVFIRRLLDSCYCNIHGFVIYEAHHRPYLERFSFSHLFWWRTLLLLFFACSLYYIVNAEQHAGRLKMKVLVYYGQRHERETQTSIAVLSIWI